MYFKNYYTRVNTGTKIKNNKVVYLFFSIFEATHWILFLSRRHPRRASASCRKSFFCLHIIFLRHHSKIRRQLQPKADKILFLKYRLRSNSLLAIRAKKKKFSKFSARPKQNPVATGDRASVISIPATQIITPNKHTPLPRLH